MHFIKAPASERQAKCARRLVFGASVSFVLSHTPSGQLPFLHPSFPLSISSLSPGDHITKDPTHPAVTYLGAKLNFFLKTTHYFYLCDIFALPPSILCLVPSIPNSQIHVRQSTGLSLSRISGLRLETNNIEIMTSRFVIAAATAAAAEAAATVDDAAVAAAAGE